MAVLINSSKSVYSQDSNYIDENLFYIKCDSVIKSFDQSKPLPDFLLNNYNPPNILYTDFSFSNDSILITKILNHCMEYDKLSLIVQLHHGVISNSICAKIVNRVLELKTTDSLAFKILGLINSPKKVKNTLFDELLCDSASIYRYTKHLFKDTQDVYITNVIVESLSKDEIFEINTWLQNKSSGRCKLSESASLAIKRRYSLLKSY